ncbi:MAG: S9 family peptidase [Caulobacteraceae bacterium]|nr:S9 family peptidase [Caulobacter sp.]
MVHLLSMLAAAVALAVPPARSETVMAAFGQLPAMQDVSISPTGAAYAYQAAVGDKRFMVVRSAADGKVLQTVDANRFKVRNLSWVDDGHLLVTFTGTYAFTGADVYELPAVMLVDLARHRLRQLVPSEDGLRTLVVATHENGHAYGYFSGEGDTVKRADLDTGQVVTSTSLPRGTSQIAMAPDARILARIESADEGRAWRLLAGADSGRVLAQGRSEHDAPAISAQGRTPGSILFSKPDDGLYDNVREVTPADGKISEPLVTGAQATPIHDRKTRLLIGFTVEGRSERVVFLDPAIADRWAAVKAAFPGEDVRLESYDDAMQHWIVSVRGPHDLGRYFLVQLANGRALPLGEAYPDVAPADIGPQRWFDYRAADGAKLEGVLTLPPGRDPRGLPVVVMPHGGPAAVSRPYDGETWWREAIASRGYAVFEPNYRGSTGYGRDFERAGWGQWGKLMQTDVSDGLAALAAQGIVDPKRACIVGWSYGGYAALAGVTLQTGVYRCAVAGGAVSDLAGMLGYEYAHAGGSRSPVMRYWRASMALRGADDPAAAAVSPAHYANRLQVPLMLIHGHDDTVVPFSQAEEMDAAARRAGKPVQLVVLPGEDHWLSSGATRTRMLDAMMGFLEKNDPADAAPAPARPSA